MKTNPPSTDPPSSNPPSTDPPGTDLEESSAPAAPRPELSRRSQALEISLAVAAFLAVLLFARWIPAEPVPWWVALPLAATVGFSLYHWLTRKQRRREDILRRPFPAEWEVVLQREVVFFQALSPQDKVRFRREIQVFLGEKLVTGIGTSVDDTVRVLAAASAVIPIFGYPEWEWSQISEILIYPGRFNEEYQFQDAHGRQILGMVGSGAMNRIMILAKPDLLHGYRNPEDKRNVGLHEFAHLVDKTDGSVDGVPEAALGARFIKPWIELMRRKMLEMEAGDSDLNPYGLTNEAEFFAVAAEYFFEQPGLMKRKHPQLYAMLSRIFRQDLASRAREMIDAAVNRKRRFGRNSPCPCGSGKKYKKCCLRKAKATARARR